MPIHSSPRARFLLTITLVALFGFSACRRGPSLLAGGTGGDASEESFSALALLPPDADLIFSVDVERLRGQPVWRMVLGSLAKNIEVRERLDDFVAHTGLDPARQLRHVVVALPGDPKEERRVVIVADVDEVDTQRVTSWLQRPAGTRVSVVVRKRNQIILGVGGWAPFVAALTNSDTTLASAKDNLVLRRLCARAADGHFFWFAALIPPGVRSAMREDRRFGDAAALMRISGFLDVDATLRASVVAELSNAEDAGHLSRRLSAFLNETKRNPDLLLVGLSPYLDGLRVEARGSRLLASYEIPAAHQDEVFEHIENMLRRSGKTSPQQGQTK